MGCGTDPDMSHNSCARLSRSGGCLLRWEAGPPWEGIGQPFHLVDNWPTSLKSSAVTAMTISRRKLPLLPGSQNSNEMTNTGSDLRKELWHCSECPERCVNEPFLTQTNDSASLNRSAFLFLLALFMSTSKMILLSLFVKYMLLFFFESSVQYVGACRGYIKDKTRDCSKYQSFTISLHIPFANNRRVFYAS